MLYNRHTYILLLNQATWLIEKETYQQPCHFHTHKKFKKNLRLEVRLSSQNTFSPPNLKVKLSADGYVVNKAVLKMMALMSAESSDKELSRATRAATDV